LQSQPGLPLIQRAIGGLKERKSLSAVTRELVKSAHLLEGQGARGEAVEAGVSGIGVSAQRGKGGMTNNQMAGQGRGQGRPAAQAEITQHGKLHRNRQSGQQAREGTGLGRFVQGLAEQGVCNPFQRQALPGARQQSAQHLLGIRNQSVQASKSRAPGEESASRGCVFGQ